LLASAQDTVIPSLAQNGRITFTGVSNVSQYATGYRVQWSSSAQGPWTNFQTLAALDTIPPSSDGLGLMKQQLPMYYRVVASLATNSTAGVAGNGPGNQTTGPTVSTNPPVSNPTGGLPSGGNTTTTTTSATSSNITLGAVAAVVESDGKYNAFPGVTMLPDGRLMAVYRKGTDHYQSDDGVLYAKFSSNTGATWTGETCLYAPKNSPYGIYPDARDPEIRTLKNGTILLSFFEYGARRSIFIPAHFPLAAASLWNYPMVRSCNLFTPRIHMIMVKWVWFFPQMAARRGVDTGPPERIWPIHTICFIPRPMRCSTRMARL